MALLKVAAGLIVLPFDNVRKREAIADIGDCWRSSRASQRAARSIGPGTGLAIPRRLDPVLASYPPTV
jgi:hypothetical protein